MAWFWGNPILSQEIRNIVNRDVKETLDNTKEIYRTELNKSNKSNIGPGKPVQK